MDYVLIAVPKPDDPECYEPILLHKGTKEECEAREKQVKKDEEDFYSKHGDYLRSLKRPVAEDYVTEKSFNKALEIYNKGIIEWSEANPYPEGYDHELYIF